MSLAVDLIEKEQCGREIPKCKTGDKVRVHVKVVEGEKTRTQAFEGVVIAYQKAGNRSTLTVRKVSYGVGVERIFPVYSPFVEKVEVLQRGKVHKARLYYLRDLEGKAARIREDKEEEKPE